MIWAGISKNGRTRICIEEYGLKINQQEYKKILIPYAEIMFSEVFIHYFMTAHWRRSNKMDTYP